MRALEKFLRHDGPHDVCVVGLVLSNHSGCSRVCGRLCGVGGAADSVSTLCCQDRQAGR